MATRKKAIKKQDEVLIDISEVGAHAEDFFERYQKQILIGAVALVVIVGGWFGYKNLISKPKQKEAIEQMAQAELMFERDSFNLALTNPGGGFPGFVDIIKKYGGTDAGNAAEYYAGISNLNLGQFDAALKYLEDFSPKGQILPAMKNGALGDVWAEKGDLNKALNYYKKAADSKDNEFITPYYLKKYAMLSEKQGKPKDALETWQKIKSDYPFAAEARDADKYIARLQ